MKNVFVKSEIKLTFRSGIVRERILYFNGDVEDFYKHIKELLDDILIYEVKEVD